MTWDIGVTIAVAIIAAISTSVLAPVVQRWLNRNNKNAGAAVDWTTSLSTLNKELEAERQARRCDRDMFKKQIAELEGRHQGEIDELTKRLNELEKENHELLQENHLLRVRLNGIGD
jgi:Tfp pilus assembly major pilin PilA